MAYAVPTDSLGLMVALVDGTLVARAVLGIWIVDVEFGLVAASSEADVVLAVVRAILLVMKAPLETALVVEAEVASWCCELTTSITRSSTGDVLVAVDGLPSVREAHA